MREFRKKELAIRLNKPAMLAALSLTAGTVLTGCGEGAENNEEEIIPITTTVKPGSSVGAFSGGGCLGGKKKNNRETLGIERSSAKHLSPWKVSGLGVSDNMPLAQEVLSEVVQKTQKKLKGIKIEEENSRNDALLAEMLGVAQGQLMENYPKKGDIELRKKLGSYGLLKNIFEIYGGKIEKEVERIIMKILERRKEEGQNIQLFQKGGLDFFQSSRQGSLTLLNDLLKEFLQSGVLSFESLEVQEQWEFFSVEVFEKMLELSLRSNDGVSREKYKKIRLVVLSLIKNAMGAKREGLTEAFGIQLKGLQAWVENNGIAITASVIFGQDINAIVASEGKKIMSQQKDNLALRREEMRFVEERIPTMSFQEKPATRLEVMLVGLNKLGGNLSVAGLPAGVTVKIGNSEDPSIYSDQVLNLAGEMYVEPRVEKFFLRFAIEESYMEKKKKEGVFGKFEENIILNLQR
ncbi:hypothetical protein HON22_05805 [Candidatus Peregrinibacteria bacterium]|nr:hypothetical protein [Candidatus Peregrinibacteria bacterium]